MTAWLQVVVTHVLEPYEGKANFVKAARQFLTQMFIRSPESSGSFHLIRELYDEYIFLLIEHKVALERGETRIVAMRERNTMKSVQYE